MVYILYYKNVGFGGCSNGGPKKNVVHQNFYSFAKSCWAISFGFLKAIHAPSTTWESGQVNCGSSYVCFRCAVLLQDCFSEVGFYQTAPTCFLMSQVGNANL